MLNLDTHVFLYAVAGALRPREAKLLGADRWSISAIVLWEIAATSVVQKAPLVTRDRALLKSKIIPLDC